MNLQPPELLPQPPGKPDVYCLPEGFALQGMTWRRIKVFKNGIFSAAGAYLADDGRKAVLKVFRPYSSMGISFGWVSRWQAAHEETVYRRLQDIDGVPKWIGRYGRTGTVHEFIPGCDLSPEVKLKDNFFEELEKLLRLLHARKMCYLDANKPDNILVGDDGKPYLIDLEIAWVQPPFPLSLVTYPLFCMFRNSDLYHLKKHERQFAPGRIGREEIARLRPWYVKLHRLLTTPLRRKRRDYLRKAGWRDVQRPPGSETR